MRLIDADALLEKVQFRNPIDNHNAEVIAGCVNLTRRIIDNSPTIDAVPVVRCKDCKWFADNNGGEWYGCWLFNGIFHGQSDIPTSDDFCSYGERKDGDGND